MVRTHAARPVWNSRVKNWESFQRLTNATHFRKKGKVVLRIALRLRGYV